MKCRICGNEYINLGVHVQKKHMPCDEYRVMFNIKLSEPLCDKELSDSLSASQMQRLEDEEWLKKCREMCEKNKGQRKKVTLPKVSKKHLIDMNRETGENYRSKMIPAIKQDYLDGMSPTDIRRKHGVAQMTLRDWVKMGLLPERNLEWVFKNGTHTNDQKK